MSSWATGASETPLPTTLVLEAGLEVQLQEGGRLTFWTSRVLHRPAVSGGRPAAR